MNNIDDQINKYINDIVIPSTTTPNIQDDDVLAINTSTLSDNFINNNTFSYSMPNNINIFNNILRNIINIKNDEVRKFVNNFTNIFKSLLVAHYNASNNLNNYLPPLAIDILEDDSVSIEWIFKDFRIGFSIEPKVDESTWYIVSNKILDDFTMSGALKPSIISLILNNIIQITLRNT